MDATDAPAPPAPDEKWAVMSQNLERLVHDKLQLQEELEATRAQAQAHAERLVRAHQQLEAQESLIRRLLDGKPTGTGFEQEVGA